MPRTSLTPEQRLASIDQQIEQLKARRQRETAKLRVLDRKQDTRRKVIVGALALEHATRNSAFANELTKIIHQFVTRPEDRALFDLTPLPDAPPSQGEAVQSFTASSAPS